ncbi:hypothetical protein RMCBS344292_16329 [Rhizopus microsporus]|nr:hypothetical protein RMCBS344292_16329 [Rhizopus microsporus]
MRGTLWSLNSILDLSNLDDSQEKLFDSKIWKVLREKYGQAFHDNAQVVSKNEGKLEEIEKLAKAYLRDACAYVYKNEMKSTSSNEAGLFAIYAHHLEILEYHGYVFDKDIDITEADLTVKMWGCFLEKLFRQTALRCKWCEFAGDSSEATDSPSFKADLKVVRDTLLRRNKEAGAGNMEIARMGASVIKACSDKTKLLIESKCVLDHLVRASPHWAMDVAVPALQIIVIGNKATLLSMRLVAPGMYVAVKEVAATIPGRASYVKDFRQVINLLFKFKRASLDVAKVYLQGSETVSSNSTSWLRRTWIPPKKQQEENSARCTS